jgi:hypothetical protein
VVREAFQLQQDKVSACWESALVRRAGLSGGRSVRLRVAPSGEVVFGHVVSNQSNSEDEAVDFLLDKCLVEIARATRFPNASGGNADAIYSWVFARRAR